MALKVEILGAGAEKKIYSFHKAVITIGRGQDNDVVIDSNQVSKYHCRLTVRGQKVEIEDLQSTNGLRVNGQTVTRTVLLPEDQVSLSFAVSPFKVVLDSILEPKDLGFEIPGAPEPEDESSSTMVAQITLDEAIREQIAQNAAQRAARKQSPPAEPFLRPSLSLPSSPEAKPEPKPTPQPKPLPYQPIPSPQSKKNQPWVWIGLSLLIVGAVIVILIFTL